MRKLGIILSPSFLCPLFLLQVIRSLTRTWSPLHQQCLPSPLWHTTLHYNKWFHTSAAASLLGGPHITEEDVVSCHQQLIQKKSPTCRSHDILESASKVLYRLWSPLGIHTGLFFKNAALTSDMLPLFSSMSVVQKSIQPFVVLIEVDMPSKRPVPLLQLLH